MNTMQTVWLTSKGMRRLQAEQEQLKNYLRKLRSDIRSATLSFEDDTSADKKREQEVAASKLGQLEKLLQRAKLLKTTSKRSPQAAVGSQVQYKQGNDLHNVTLVSSIEADPFENLISVESPLGKALLDKRAGDVAHMVTPIGERKFMIVEIE